MTINEFRYEFDINWNNIMSNQAPGLSAYEISVFLTQAQESIVKTIYSGSRSAGFETNEEHRSYLASITQQGYPEKIENQQNYPHIISGTKLYNLDRILDKNENLIEKPWFITYEQVKFSKTDRCIGGNNAIVKPITHDTFWDIYNNPFKKSNDKRVLRLTFVHNEKNLAELITNNDVDEYMIRYIRKPKPIILEDLTDYGVTIDGKVNNIDAGFLGDECCELNSNLHRAILVMGVQFARQAWLLTDQR